MNSSYKPIKTILSKHFFSFWRANNHKFPESLRSSIFKNVTCFLECGDPKVGYTSFICLKCILDIIAKYAKSTNSQHLKNKISLAYRKHKEGFYVNAKSKVKNSKFIAKYIGRYLARPAIAEYRITSFNDKTVTFWFEDLVTKKKSFLTLSISKFIGRILSHIPPQNFKMVRRFGLYSRRSKNKIPNKIKLFKTKSSWAERYFKAFGINPLICRKCGSQLHLLEIFHVKYGVIQYNKYSP